MADESKELMTVDAEVVDLGVLPTKGPAQLVQQATEVAKVLAGVINDRKLFNVIQGKKYVMVEGWSTLGGMIGVLPREVEVKRHEDGAYEAMVELIRTSDGLVIGRASALCGMDEARWSRGPEYARRSMAVTRATGKAYRLGFSWIIKLAGYEATPAEEIPQEEAAPAVEVSTGKDWTGAAPHLAKALKAAGILKATATAKQVVNFLDLTPFGPKVTDKEMLEWGKIYRARRDAGEEPVEAARSATQVYFNEQNPPAEANDGDGPA